MDTKLFRLFYALFLIVVSTTAQQTDGERNARLRFQTLTNQTRYMTIRSNVLRSKEISPEADCLKFQHWSWWRVMRTTYLQINRQLGAGQHSQQELENYKNLIKSYQEMLHICNSSKEFQTGIQTVVDTAYPEIDSKFENVYKLLGYCTKSPDLDKCSEALPMIKARNRFGLLSNLIINLNATDDWRNPMSSESPEVEKCISSLSDGWVYMTRAKFNILMEKFKDEGPFQQEIEAFRLDLKKFKSMLGKCPASQDFLGQIQVLSNVTEPIIDVILGQVNNLMGYNVRVDPKEKVHLKLGELQNVILNYMRKESSLLREKETSAVRECLALQSINWLDTSMDVFEQLVENFERKQMYPKQLEDFQRFLKTFRNYLNSCEESAEFQTGIKTIADLANSKIDAIFNDINNLLGFGPKSNRWEYILGD